MTTTIIIVVAIVLAVLTTLAAFTLGYAKGREDHEAALINTIKNSDYNESVIRFNIVDNKIKSWGATKEDASKKETNDAIDWMENHPEEYKATKSYENGRLKVVYSKA